MHTHGHALTYVCCQGSSHFSGLISRLLCALSLSLPTVLSSSHTLSLTHTDTMFWKKHMPAHAHIAPFLPEFPNFGWQLLSGHERNWKEVSKRRGRDSEESGGEEIRRADRCSTQRFFAPQRRKRGMNLTLLLLLLHHFLFPLLSVSLLPFLFSLVKPTLNRIDFIPLILRKLCF